MRQLPSPTQKTTSFTQASLPSATRLTFHLQERYRWIRHFRCCDRWNRSSCCNNSFLSSVSASYRCGHHPARLRGVPTYRHCWSSDRCYGWLGCLQWKGYSPGYSNDCPTKYVGQVSYRRLERENTWLLVPELFTLYPFPLDPDD